MPGQMTTRTDPSDLSEFLAACATLGQARFVLRNCSAFMEMFCSTERLGVGDRWLTIRFPDAHLHVELARVAGVRLRESGEADAPAPSIWFHGPCGTPFLLLILDQTDGVRRAAQEAVFRRLRERYGEEVVFEMPELESARATLH